MSWTSPCRQSSLLLAPSPSPVSREYETLIRLNLGPFSPLVSPVPRPTTHPILGSSKSCFRGGSDPMVVSRRSGWAEKDGSGFWRLSYPQLLALSSFALPVDSPWEAPAARSAVLHSVSPSRYLTTSPFTTSITSFPGCQGTVIKRKTSHPTPPSYVFWPFIY